MIAFWTTYVLVFVAEFADKSRLAALLLSATYKAPGKVCLGMTLGYAVVLAVSVLVGKSLASVFPIFLVQSAGVAVLIIAGVWTMVFGMKKGAPGQNFLSRFVTWSPVFVSFLTILLFEMVDRTQFAVASLSAVTQESVFVYTGALGAAATLNVLTVSIGQRLAQVLSTQRVRMLSGFVFILYGLLLVAQMVFDHD